MADRPNDTTAFPVWTHQQKKLWIYNARPCIEVFDRQLLSLSLILGIRLRGEAEKFVPHGPGAFGSVLMSEKQSMFTAFSLALNRRSRLFKPSAGCGYSTLFATYMACGLLPFAQITLPREDHESKVEHNSHRRIETHCIVITAETREAIVSGMPLDNSNIDHWDRPEYGLNDLSLSTVPDKYWPRKVTNETTNHRDIRERKKKGCIHNVHSRFEKLGKANCVGTLCEAVAGIAFGGLVPMATKDLVDTVKATIGGSMEKEAELEKFHLLMKSIESHAKRRVKAPETAIPLFGSHQEKIACYLPANRRQGRNGDTEYFLNFRSMLHSDSTAIAVERLARLTTILDYLIGASELDKELMEESEKVQAAFNECAREIDEAYNMDSEAQVSENGKTGSYPNRWKCDGLTILI